MWACYLCGFFVLIIILLLLLLLPVRVPCRSPAQLRFCGRLKCFPLVSRVVQGEGSDHEEERDEASPAAGLRLRLGARGRVSDAR